MTEPNQMEVLNGGTTVAVQHVDGWCENIFVKKVKLRLMPQLGTALANESNEILFYVDKTVEWLDTLTDQSYLALLEEGRRLNFTSFREYWDRQQSMLKRLNLNGESSELINEAVRAQLEKAT